MAIPDSRRASGARPTVGPPIPPARSDSARTVRWRRSGAIERTADDGRIVFRHASQPHLGSVAIVAGQGSRVDDLLEFLARPRSLEELRAEFPDPELEATLIRLRNTGLVIAQSGEEEAFVAEGHLGAIVRLGEMLARQVRAYGPYLFQGDRRGEGEALLTQLEDTRRMLAAMRERLEAHRKSYVSQQVAKLPRPADGDLRIHLGCGSHQLEGWINTDVHDSELRMDLRWGLPFGDGSARYVFNSHMLEHLYYPDEALAVVRDVHRVLQAGGVLRVLVPDIEKCIRAYVDHDEQFFARRKQYWPWAAHCETRLEHFLAYAGAGAPPHDFVGHKYGYDFETLSRLLQRAGFASVVRSGYMKSKHPDLRVDHASIGAQFQVRGRHYCLFVEATKA